MPEIASTAIEAIDYDAFEREMHVRFRASGRTYVFAEVPETLFRRFLAARSKGRFFAAYVRPFYRTT